MIEYPSWGFLILAGIGAFGLWLAAAGSKRHKRWLRTATAVTGIFLMSLPALYIALNFFGGIAVMIWAVVRAVIDLVG